MRIAYVTSYNVLNPRNWHQLRLGPYGRGYYIARALKDQSFALDYICPLKKIPSLPVAFKLVFYSFVKKKRYFHWVDPYILKNYARQISQKLHYLNSDIIFSPENVGTLSYLECKQPIVMWTDAPKAAMIDYYPSYYNLCDETTRDIFEMEKLAFNRCKLLIFSSNWGAKKAADIYKIDSSKIKVIPAGANIDYQRGEEEVSAIINSRSTDVCRLLFLGADWLRKGGDIAVAVAEELNKKGLPVELTIVGSKPITSEPLPSFVKSVGFLNKTTKEGREKLESLLKESHFLILPSRAEAYGIVLPEANSYGVPCLTTNAGGIPTIVKDGLNGKIFSTDANTGEYCSYVSDLFSDFSRYKQLALSSFNEFKTRFDWSAVGETLKNLLNESCIN
ncbi:MAG: glycosyltransferase family 4 protein [Candidatus Omnitrophota bacterium]|nr:MAG: glycosyltransferase family 4 protein [Candidatus Omnitrophota bacterium]